MGVADLTNIRWAHVALLYKPQSNMTTKVYCEFKKVGKICYTCLHVMDSGNTNDGMYLRLAV